MHDFSQPAYCHNYRVVRLLIAYMQVSAAQESAAVVNLVLDCPMQLVLGGVGCSGGTQVASQDGEKAMAERQLPDASGALESAEALEPQQAVPDHDRSDFVPLEADIGCASSPLAAEQEGQAAVTQDHCSTAYQADAGERCLLLLLLLHGNCCCPANDY